MTASDSRFDLTRYPADVLQSARESFTEIREAVRHEIVSLNRLHWVVFLAILAVGIGLRLYFINRPMGYDESTTFLTYARRPFADALSLYNAPNNHLLNTALIRLAYLVFGNAPWVIRLPALIAGILMIPATYALTRSLYPSSSGAALLASGLMAAQSWVVAYSTDGRGYTLLCLFSILLVIIGHRLLGQWRTADSLAFAAIGALAMYTIPIGVYPILLVVVWMGGSLFSVYLITQRRLITGMMVRDSIIAGLMMTGLTVLLYAPVISREGWDALANNQFVAPQPIPDVLRISGGYGLRALELWNNDLLVVEIVLAFGCVVALANHRRLANNLWLPVLPFALIFPVVVLIQRVVPFPRVWVFLIPVYLATASAGWAAAMVIIEGRLTRLVRSTPTAERRTAFSYLARGLTAAVCVGLSAQIVAVETDHQWNRDPIEKQTPLLGERIGQEITPDDAILSYSWEYPAIRYYLTYYYGMPAAEFVNWGRIVRDGIKPAKLFIVLKMDGETLETDPVNVIAERGLSPDDYGTPEFIERYGNAALYVALRK